jgi:hypothetical protein
MEPINEITIVKPKTIQELQTKRDEFKKKLDDNKEFWKFGVNEYWVGKQPIDYFLSCTYRQDLHKKTYGDISDETNFNNDSGVICFDGWNIRCLQKQPSQTLETLKKIRIKNYSALGSATMAEKVTFQEKQNFIQKLLTLGFVSTPEDKELALVEKWERCAPSIIKRICTFQHAPLLTEINMPKEIYPNIALLMFNTEESLL